MADKSNIEWCDATWNPVVGCSKVSDGCANCYAEQMVNRFTHLTGVHRYSDQTGERYCDGLGWDGSAHFMPHKLEQPFHWRKPRKIFVCSMGDLFHESLTNEQIAAVFGVMAATPQHQYVVLTKRLQRAMKWFNWVDSIRHPRYGEIEPSVECAFQLLRQAEPDGDGPIHCKYGPNPDAKWPLENVIMCASVENQPTVDERAPLLFQIPAKWHGVSVEPMLESIDLYMDMYESETGYWHAHDCPNYCDYACDGFTSEGGIDLVICGAETGPGKRPFKDEWALDLRDQCREADTPFFFKKDGNGNGTLCGVEYHEWVK